jgi:hypothetical protein
VQQWHGILLFRRANFDFLFHKPFFLSLKVACWVNVFIADSEEQRIKRQDVLIQISFSIFYHLDNGRFGDMCAWKYFEEYESNIIVNLLLKEGFLGGEKIEHTCEDKNRPSKIIHDPAISHGVAVKY